MNGMAIYFGQTETTRHLVGLTLCNFYYMINIDTAETNEFIDITIAVLSDLYDEFGEILMKENDMEMPQDASSAFGLQTFEQDPEVQLSSLKRI